MSRARIKNDEIYKALRNDRASKEKAARIANAQVDQNRDSVRKGEQKLPYEAWTKDALYDRAAELGVSGRSSMSKSELIDALRDP